MALAKHRHDQEPIRCGNLASSHLRAEVDLRAHSQMAYDARFKTRRLEAACAGYGSPEEATPRQIRSCAGSGGFS
jgi:hypothetical protein